MEDDAVRIEYASLNIFTDSTYGEKVLFRYSNKTNEALMLKFVRKVRFVDNTLQKRKRLKYKIFLEPNQTVGAKLKDPITEESPFQLFLGWNSDSWYVVSFRIDKVNH